MIQVLLNKLHNTNKKEKLGFCAYRAATLDYTISAIKQRIDEWNNNNRTNLKQNQELYSLPRKDLELSKDLELMASSLPA